MDENLNLYFYVNLESFPVVTGAEQLPQTAHHVPSDRDSIISPLSPAPAGL